VHDLLAKTQEAPQLVTKVGERFEVLLFQIQLQLSFQC
jgi:hypothetical protein